MSRLLITIDTDNEAFQTNGWQREAAQVLAQLSARLAYNQYLHMGGMLCDTASAACGAWDFEPDEP